METWRCEGELSNDDEEEEEEEDKDDTDYYTNDTSIQNDDIFHPGVK